MRNIWKYLIAGLLVFLIACLIALPFFGFGWGRSFAMRGWMMRPGRMPGIDGLPRIYGMPGIPGMPGFSLFGGLLRLGMFLIPLLLIALLVAGVAALFRGQSRAPAPTLACPNCQRSIQPGWVACPYCGHGLVQREPPGQAGGGT